MKSQEDVLLEQATTLAGACARAGVKDYQLGQVLAHLKIHRDVAATRRLLESFPGSRFAQRSRSSRRQFEALKTSVGSALTGISDWQRAAAVVGWGKRLLKANRGR